MSDVNCAACNDAVPTAAPGVCIDIDGAWWHTPGSCRYCRGACPECLAGTRRGSTIERNEPRDD